VADLAGDLRAGRVDGLGQPAEAGEAVGAHDDLFRVGPAFRRDRQVRNRVVEPDGR
jgi:hypothetical protein